MRSVIVPFFIPHQGCPHDCVFCNQRALTGSDAVLPTAGQIIETVEAYRHSAGVTAVEAAFYGGTFTALPPELQRQLLLPLQPLLAKGELSTVRVSTRPDAISAASVALLKEMHVSIVELGVQTMDDVVLGRAGRGHLAADTVTAIHLLRQAGVQVGVQLMPGLPGGTVAEATDSLAKVLDLGPDFLRIYPTVVVAGTRLAELAEAGSYRPWSLDSAVECCAALLQMAARAGVPVIRVGLQPTDDLAAAGAILAGPFHPAFRQLVETERWYRLLLQLCRAVAPGTAVSLSCAPTRVADLVGHRRHNVARLADTLGLRVTGVEPVPGLEETALLVKAGETVLQGDLLQCLEF